MDVKFEKISIRNSFRSILLNNNYIDDIFSVEHKNIKLFMTQGGLQSTEEAIRAQVPLIIIPFGSDQFQNGGRLQQLGIGKCLSRSELTEQVLNDTIHEVINNDR